MRRTILHATLAASALLAAPALLHAQDDGGQPVRWHGRIEDGAWVTIRDLNGPISVEGTSGDQVEITATKHWRRGNPERVTIRITRTGSDEGNVLACALWTPDATCDENGYSSHQHGDENHNNDVSVSFEVRVPRGVRVRAATVNGEVRVDGTREQVYASTVNGAVDATSSGGPVHASTVNGEIRARMASVGDAGSLDYSTVNGSVELTLPASLNGELEASTVNGGIESDYPITVQGRFSPKHVRATIGNGQGPRLHVSTVNGSITLRKS